VKTQAIVIQEPQRIHLTELSLNDMGHDDVLVEIAYSGISTGTEKLIWNGTMPNFPGMGYPLVPGYESVGKVIDTGSNVSLSKGQFVFVPGANCYGDVKGLFGGAASHIVIPQQRVTSIQEDIGSKGILLALAATAYHVTQGNVDQQPDLIIGHGVLGRLIARIAACLGKSPVVWETNQQRVDGANAYQVIHPKDDDRHDYGIICDASGDVHLLNQLITRIRKQGEIILAGFYDESISFMFAPAFMREMKMRIAAQWLPSDLEAVCKLVQEKKLSLDNLITHESIPQDAEKAYQTAFTDKQCLKMILNWRPQ
jgi:3-hydroxyethyl bacteriochlorophyllide a dehydrogenase